MPGVSGQGNEKAIDTNRCSAPAAPFIPIQTFAAGQDITSPNSTYGFNENGPGCLAIDASDNGVILGAASDLSTTGTDGAFSDHDFTFILTSGTSGPCTSFDACPYYSAPIASNLTVDATTVNLTAINNQGWAIGYDDYGNALVWTGTSTGFTGLSPMEAVTAISNSGQVAGQTGTSAYLWTSGATTTVCPAVVPGQVQSIISLIPAPYQSEILDLNPIDISAASATDGSVNILLSGTYKTNSSGASPGLFLLTLTSGTSAISTGTAETIFRQVFLPSNANIALNSSNGVINSQGVIAALGTSPARSGTDAFLLVPVSLRWLNGQTQDFDGTTPTTVIPAPENPQYSNDVAGAGGVNQFGIIYLMHWDFFYFFHRIGMRVCGFYCFSFSRSERIKPPPVNGFISGFSSLEIFSLRYSISFASLAFCCAISFAEFSIAPRYSLLRLAISSSLAERSSSGSFCSA